MSNLEAQRFGALIRSIASAVALKLYTRKVNPTPGGPFGQVWVNAQGQVYKASGGGAGQMIAYAKNNNSPTQNISASTTARVNYNSKTYDPLTTITTGSSWVFTAPYDGIYEIYGSVVLNATAWTAGQTMTFHANVNGSAFERDFHRFEGTGSSFSWIIFQASHVVNLSTGGTFYWSVQNDTTRTQSVHSGFDSTYFHAKYWGAP